MAHQKASIPESVICYRAGEPDPGVPGNRIVDEWVCPNHGVVHSPGGGISMTVTLEGGPWDGRMMLWSPCDEQIVMVKNEAGGFDRHKYSRKSQQEFFTFVWRGEVPCE